MGKSWIVLSFVLVAGLIAAASAWADLTLTQTSRIIGPEPDTVRELHEKVYVKGQKMKLENVETGKAIIVDRRARRIYQVDVAAGEYFVVPFLDAQVNKEVLAASDYLKAGLSKLLFRTELVVSDIQTRNSAGLFAQAERELRKEYQQQAAGAMQGAESEQERKQLQKEAEKALQEQIEKLRRTLRSGKGAGGTQGPPGFGGGGAIGPEAFNPMGFGGAAMGPGSGRPTTYRDLMRNSVTTIDNFISSFARSVLDLTLGGVAAVQQEGEKKNVAGLPCNLYSVIVSLGAEGPPGMPPGMMAGPAMVGGPGPGRPGGGPGGGMMGPTTRGGPGAQRSRGRRALLGQMWLTRDRFGQDLSPLAFLDGAMDIFRPAAVAAFRTTAGTGKGRGGQVPAHLRLIPMHTRFRIVLRNAEGQYNDGWLETEVTAQPDLTVIDPSVFSVKGLTRTEGSRIDYWD